MEILDGRPMVAPTEIKHQINSISENYDVSKENHLLLKKVAGEQCPYNAKLLTGLKK